MNLEIAKPAPRRSWFKTLLLIVCVAVITAAATVWVLMVYIFPREFKPVQLSAKEERVLEQKINTLTGGGAPPRSNEPAAPSSPASPPALQPERYAESDADREIQFTQRELNGLLAKNTDLAQRLVIHLSNDLASAKLLIPLDPDFPVVGGKTLKVTAGMELRFAQQRPVVILRGVSVWGVPIPNAWLGGLKNIDLVSEFGMQGGFWESFAAGVEHIQVRDGHLAIKLKP